MFSYDEFLEKLVPGILVCKVIDYACPPPTDKRKVMFLLDRQAPSGFLEFRVMNDGGVKGVGRTSFTPYELYVKMIDKEMEFLFL